LKHSSAANRIPDRRMVELLRASTMDKTRIPYRKPLYWKWIWSMMSSPGDNKTDKAAACAVTFDFEVLT
jgi:hypothetical protein